jgi:hypothetical protein
MTSNPSTNSAQPSASKKGSKRGLLKRAINMITPYVILNLLVFQKRIDYDVIFKIAGH